MNVALVYFSLLSLQTQISSQPHQMQDWPTGTWLWDPAKNDFSRCTSVSTSTEVEWELFLLYRIAVRVKQKNAFYGPGTSRMSAIYSKTNCSSPCG